MFKLKDKIFSLFTPSDQLADASGLLKRFNELVAGDFDSKLLPKVEQLAELVLLADTTEERLLPTLERMLGMPFITDDVAIRRRLLRSAIDFYRNKGNQYSYNLMFNLLGYGDASFVRIERDEDSASFDSKIILYKLVLSGGRVLEHEDIEIIIRADLFLRPMYATLAEVEGGGNIHTLFEIYIDENGDLLYDTKYAITIRSLVETGGDLVMQNDSEYRFEIVQGDMIQH